MKTLLATTMFFAFFFLFSMLYIPAGILITLVLALPAGLTPVGHRKVGLRLTRWFIRGYGQTVVRLAFPWVRLRLRDCCGLPFGTSCIYISNHQSVGDIFLLAFLPMKEFVFLSNRWPFKIPVLGFFASLAGFLNLQTSEPGEVIERTRQLFSKKVAIISFPEGTRSRTGALGPFHTTVFRIALQNQVPIVPVCIEGTHRTFPRERVILRPGTVQMHILPAMEPDSFRNLTPYQLKQRVHDIIARELATMEGAAA